VLLCKQHFWNGCECHANIVIELPRVTVLVFVHFFGFAMSIISHKHICVDDIVKYCFRHLPLIASFFQKLELCIIVVYVCDIDVWHVMSDSLAQGLRLKKHFLFTYPSAQLSLP